MTKRIFASILVTSFLACPLTVLAEPQGTAQIVTLDGIQARAAAWHALQLGKPAITLKIAGALARKIPRDFELIFLQSQALLALGHNTAAASAAKDAFNNAKTKNQRFDAAHMVAKAHFANKSNTRAQFWLRRAAHIAPDARAKQLSQRDFQFIRRNNPLSTRVFINSFPTSNINNGSANTKVGGTLLTTAPSALPHSGTGLTAGFETTYTKRLSKRSALRLGVFALGTTFQLSSEAKALGSGKKGSDFAFATVEARIGLTMLPKEFNQVGWGRLNLDAAIGHSWYGGDPLSVHYRLEAKKDYHFSPRLVGDFGVRLSVQNRLDNPIASSRSGQIEIGMTRLMANQQRLRIGVTALRSNSDSNLVQYTAIGAEMRYSLPTLTWDIRPTMTLGYEHKSFPKSSNPAVSRKDDKLSASLSLFFPNLSYYGFAPNLNLSANRNKSTDNIRNTRDLRLSVGFNSTF